MLPARALFYAVLGALLVALMCGVMLLSSYQQHLLFGYYTKQKRLLHNCQSGVNLILGSDATQIPKTTLDLFQQKKDSVVVEQKPWGVLDVAFVKSWAGYSFQRDSVCRSFFIGRNPVKFALQLSEGTSPLSVCGNTKIVGDVYLPQEGVESGFINGRPFQGQQLIDGKVNTVKFIEKEFLKSRFDKLANFNQIEGGGVMEIDSLIHSFGQETKILKASKWNTAGMYLKGNILLIANNEIRVSRSSYLEDVLLIASEITIESGFIGTIQAFATESLITENDVLLDYPSLLGLLPQKHGVESSPQLRLGRSSELTGAIVVPSFSYQKYKPLTTIETDAIVNGQVWVNGQLQHKGIVKGMISCDEFFLQTTAAVYENYLLDAVIDRSQLSPYYLSPFILGEAGSKQVLKEIE